MPLNERNDPEMAYRRGYQDGALELLHDLFHRFLDPAMQQVVCSWIELDINGWRLRLCCVSHRHGG